MTDTKPPDTDGFYIGWSSKAPDRAAAFTRRIVILLLIVAVAGAVTLAASQRTIGVATFEYGKKRSFQGVFWKDPYPHLAIERPGRGDGYGVSRYPLVEPFKFGLSPALSVKFDGQRVILQGKLIYRDGQTIIELLPESLQGQGPAPRSGEAVSLGTHTLRGEIVDSKCFLGVMNPGHLKPHRACAIRCISGGVPPVLLVRDRDGNALYLLLSGADGRTINREVLAMVAEPIEITGEVVRHDNLLLLKAEPAAYRVLR